MALKYQSQIDDFKLSIVCPINTIKEEKIIPAYRLSFESIDNELNFLPNVIFDKIKNHPYNYIKADDSIKCKRCGASFYTNTQDIYNRWNSLTVVIREKLGYTHIASGNIDSKDGHLTEPDDKGHFGFYENEGVDLKSKFEIIAKL